MPRNIFMMVGVAVLALFATAAFAQVVTGTIVGTVKDNSGAFVANATVTITNTDENVVVRTLHTNGSGEYVAPLLPVGHYAVTAEAARFKRGQQTHITLDVNASLTVNFSLQVGSAQETVTVTQPPAEIDLETAQSQTVISSAQINELAINTRNYEQLVSLMPGVSTGLASDQLYVGASNPVGTSNQINFSINGGRPTQNAWNIDGADNLDRGANLTLLAYPSLDSIQEFSVQRGQFGSEYGRSSSGQINVITKSGTNGFHGDVYEFFRNDDLDANNYFNNEYAVGRPPLRYNDFGGTIGGPIFKDKTFFFFSEEVRRVITYTTFTSNSPTAAERAGTFPVAVCLNAACTDTGTQVTAIDPAAQAYLTDIISKIPLPSDPTCTNTCPITVVGRNIFNLHQEIGRVDQVFSPRFQLFGRYENDTIPTQEPGGLFTGNAWPGVSTTSSGSPGRIISVHATNSISPTLLNDAGFNDSHGGIKSNPTGLDAAANSPAVVSAITLPFTDTLGRVPNLNFQSFAGGNVSGFGPYRDYNDDYNGFDNLTWVKGRHSFRFGGTYHWYQKNEDAADGNQGAFGFSISPPAGEPASTPPEYQEFANFLTGNAAYFSQTSLDFRAVIRQQQLELYAQDQFRVRPNLTITYGLRYSLFRPMTDANDHLTTFDPATFSLANAPQIDPCTGNFGHQLSTSCASPDVVPSTPYNPLNGIIIAGKNSPYGNAVTRSNNLDFAPRFGLAWDPFGNGKTSVRAGYGIYFDSPAVSRFESTVFNNPPFVTSDLIYNTNMDNPAAISAYVGAAPSPLVAVAPNWKTPYTEEWSLDIQREIFRRTFLDIGYYGNAGRHLTGTEDINEPQAGAYVTGLAPYGVTPPVQGGLNTSQLNYIRPYPGYDSINEEVTAFNSNYAGLQVSLKKQLGVDSLINVNYTWSHALTDAVGDYATPQNTYDLASEYGPSQFDRRHIFNASYIYNLPFFRTQSGVAGHVLGGWEISGIVTAYSGLPFSVYNYFYDPAGQGTLDPNSDASGRPDQIGNPNQATAASGPIHNFNQWFNPLAFTLSCTPGACPASDIRPGNSGNGAVRGPGLQRWDISLFKNTKINERVNTQFRAEAFNVFNHTNPDGFQNAYGFGTYVYSVRDPRIMQLALKLYY
jgi:hypothetical protein